MQMIPNYVRLQAKIELARRNLWDYCKLTNPQFYKDDRTYLKTMCDSIQSFFNQDEKKFLVINLPPLLDTANLLQVKILLNGYLARIHI